ncbi:DUF397 domain-containing protein [Streptomyces antibioticus]|uniref:DUF397 domain-containing protein n=1 Tax=Streptomyces antibioticus TaxID=1890 RepID=UPI00340E9B64
MSNTNPAESWVKSSYSGGEGGQCLEWLPARAVSGEVPVRDSKAPERGALSLSPSAWSSFVQFASGQSI